MRRTSNLISVRIKRAIATKGLEEDFTCRSIAEEVGTKPNNVAVVLVGLCKGRKIKYVRNHYYHTKVYRRNLRAKF